MSFGGGGGGGGSIDSASDTAISQAKTGEFLGYDTTNVKWQNKGLAGTAALANQGGQETLSTNNTANGSVTLSLANGNVFNLTLTGSPTLTFSGAVSGKACSFSLHVKQDGTGSRTITWPSSVKWAGGTVPTLTSGANGYDIFVFESLNGGTAWYGSLVGNDFK